MEFTICITVNSLGSPETAAGGGSLVDELRDAAERLGYEVECISVHDSENSFDN